MKIEFSFLPNTSVFALFPFTLYPIDEAAMPPPPPPRYEQSSLNSRPNGHCDGAAMAPLCNLTKRGTVRANDLLLSNGLKARLIAQLLEYLTYKVMGHEFESRSGQLFSR